MEEKWETATLAGGCFWCTEAIFKRLKGVISVVPGYAGGKQSNPSYEAVSTGLSGHAESVQVKFDPRVLSFDRLLEVFFATHDPTTLNQQGGDTGIQYRSAVFYHSEKQREIAEKLIEELNSSGKYSRKIVTELSAYNGFYEAEDYHHNFYESGQRPDYCRLVIDPKLRKLYKDFQNATV